MTDEKKQYSKAGLVASQNREVRMMLMSNLKAISTIAECGNEDYVKLILGESDFQELKNKGLFKLAYDKTNEVFTKFGFPNK